MIAWILAASIVLTTTVVTDSQTRGVGVVVKTGAGQTKEIKLYNASYALVIGNSRYQFWDSLPGVGSDVVAVRASLEKQGFKVETAENLTSEAFNQTMNKFIDDYGFEPENRLLIYYAGHGHTLASSGDQRDLGYVVPVDAPNPKTDEIGFKRKAITMDTIQNYAKRIESKHALFLFDSCFSGKLVTRNAITIPPIIEEKVSLPVRQFITAGAADQPVPDESYFRRSFVNALEGDADRNGDGYVTGTELAEYLKEKVTNYSNRTQTPQYGKINDVNLDRGDFIFVTGTPSTPKPEIPVPNPDSGESAFWKTIEDSTDERDFESYLERSARGEFSGSYTATADIKLKRLRKANALTRWEKFKVTAKSLLKYDFIYSFSEGLAPVGAGGKTGFIDESGREVIPTIYESTEGGFSEGLAAVKSGGKAGYINKSGEVVIPFSFQVGFPFSEGLAGVGIDDKYGYIDKTGKVVIAPDRFGPGSFKGGLALAIWWERPAEFIDRTGKVAISTPFAIKRAFEFYEDLAAVMIDGEKWGYIDRTGKVVIPFNYTFTSGFQGGLATVQVDGRKWGMIDRTGKMIIPPKYDLLQRFSEGLAIAYLDEKVGYIDQTDKLVIPFDYSVARNFSNGMALVRIGGGYAGGGKWGVIDRTGRKLLPVKYDEIWCEVLAKEGIFGVILNGKKGFADIYGNEFFEF